MYEMSPLKNLFYSIYTNNISSVKKYIYKNHGSWDTADTWWQTDRQTDERTEGQRSLSNKFPVLLFESETSKTNVTANLFEQNILYYT